MSKRHPLVMLIALGLAAAPLQAHYDVWVGRSSSGQLRVVRVPEYAWRLPPLGASGPLYGWLDNDPGFSSLPVPNLGADLYLLQFGATLWLELVSIDPGTKVWSPVLSDYIDAPGQRLILGSFNLHTHVNWHVDAAALGDDFFGLRSVVFRIVDTGSTRYTPSAPVALTLEVVPARAGDCDNGGTLDLTDFDAWAQCLVGPGVYYTGACGCADHDGDHDVDLRDFAHLQPAFSASATPR